MGFGDIAKKAKDFMGNEDNHGKINDFVDNAQAKHADKLGSHGDKINGFVDGQQEKRFGAGSGKDEAGTEGRTPGQ